MESQAKPWGAGTIVAATAIAGALAGWGVAHAMPRLYASEAILSVGGPETRAAQADYMDALKQRALPRAVLARLIEEDNLYASDRAKMALTDVITEMQKSIQMVPMGKTGNTFAVRFIYSDPVVAQRIATDFQARLIEENKHRVELGVPGVNLQIVDVPGVPKNPISPNVLEIILIGIGAGVAVGAYLAIRTGSRKPA